MAQTTAQQRRSGMGSGNVSPWEAERQKREDEKQERQYMRRLQMVEEEQDPDEQAPQPKRRWGQHNNHAKGSGKDKSKDGAKGLGKDKSKDNAKRKGQR